MLIMALACEKPEMADRPVSTWTPRELADEAIKRGIVTQISARAAFLSDTSHRIRFVYTPTRQDP